MRYKPIYKAIVIDKFESDISESIRCSVKFDLLQTITRNDLLKIISNYDIAIISTRINFDRELLEIATNLKWIIRMGAGVDHIDLLTCKELGINVCNTPLANIAPVTEYLFGQLLRTYKDFESHNRAVLSGNFRKGLS